MSVPNHPQPVKLVLGLIYSSETYVKSALEALSHRYGTPDMEYPPFPFDFTAYYESEMGGDLTKRFVSFRNLFPMDRLPDVKIATNALERELARPETGHRRVNLDPGYLSPANMILATNKGYSHRPYLRDGIYAELVYIYRGGTFTPLEWTYPDYRDQRSISFFNGVRKTYMNQLAAEY